MVYIPIPSTVGSLSSTFIPRDKTGRALRSVLEYCTGGSSDETSTLQAALSDVAAKGQGLHFPAGTHIKTSGTITIPADVPVVMDSGAWVEYTGTGVAIEVTEWAGHRVGASGRQMGTSVLRAVRSSRAWPLGTDTSSVGIRFVNVNWSQFVIPEVTNFETGILLEGDAGGTANNTFWLGSIVNNKRNIRFSGLNAGFANQNTFLGGSIRHDGSLPSYLGTRHLDLSTTGNGNTFLGVNMEGAYTERVFQIAASDNVFVGCRFESAPAGSCEFLAGSTSNVVLFGNGVGGPGASIFTDTAQRNVVLGSRGGIFYSDSVAGGALNGGYAAVEAQATSSNTDLLYRARNTSRVSLWDLDGSGRQRFWRSGASYPQVRITPTTSNRLGSGFPAAIEFGRGSADTDMAIGRSSANQPAFVADCPMLQKVSSQTLSSNGTVSISAYTADIHVVNLQANCTTTALNTPATETNYSQVVTIEYVQDATGGRTYVWPTNCKFAGGSAPSDTTANKRSSVTFRYDGTNWQEIGRAVAVG